MHPYLEACFLQQYLLLVRDVLLQTYLITFYIGSVVCYLTGYMQYLLFDRVLFLENAFYIL